MARSLRISPEYYESLPLCVLHEKFEIFAEYMEEQQQAKEAHERALAAKQK